MKFFIAFFLVIMISGLSYISGYKDGKKTGIDIGFNTTVDTINTILRNQIKNDTSISELIFEHSKDTSIYYISKKIYYDKPE